MGGDNISDAVVGQRLTLDVYLKETCRFYLYINLCLAIYDMFVHDCIAHDGKNDPNSIVTIINSNG